MPLFYRIGTVGSFGYLVSRRHLVTETHPAVFSRKLKGYAFSAEHETPRAQQSARPPYLFPVRMVGTTVQTHDKVERLISDGCDPLTTRPRPSPGAGVVRESLGCHGQNSPRPLLIRKAAADTLSWGSAQATDFCSGTLHEGELDCPIPTANLPT